MIVFRGQCYVKIHFIRNVLSVKYLYLLNTIFILKKIQQNGELFRDNNVSIFVSCKQMNIRVRVILPTIISNTVQGVVNINFIYKINIIILNYYQHVSILPYHSIFIFNIKHIYIMHINLFFFI